MGSDVYDPLQPLVNVLLVYKGVMQYPLRILARHLRTSRSAMYVRSVVLLSVDQRPLKHALYSWHERKAGIRQSVYDGHGNRW